MARWSNTHCPNAVCRLELFNTLIGNQEVLHGKKKKEELPDYTVANMDVDGMPWNSRRPWQIFPGDPSKSRKEFDVKVPEPGMENEVPDDLSAFQNPPMTKEERRGIIWLSLKASLTVGLIFGGAAFLFILFCVFVWLK
ncbi:MAG: hypothetical protein ACLTZM_12975 [Ruminococcus sp.]